MDNQPNIIKNFEKICADFFKEAVKKIIKKKPKDKTENKSDT